RRRRKRREDEGNPSHPGGAMWEPDWWQVLGGGLQRARHRHQRKLRRNLPPAAGARQRLLQRGQ
ncbi:hypothetical protein HPP92_008510, partial [Vanilla planifolia]